ncbi:MAG: exosome complex RNA-binding protein Rrp4 [Candidatus Undinarchaeales archaeon]|jgi:exosome complex component RRP4|nr:exosome complex RNA-binding protein Rrp4 [Candidatus Undinarchaeales archaeon]
MTLQIENRQLVLPGDKIAEGDYLLGEGTYREGTGVFSTVLGLLDAKESFLKVIPLKGKYVPKPGDLLIGVITDIAFSMWNVEINSHYSGVLSVSNGVERYIDLNSERLSDIYAIGDVILAKVDNVSESLAAGLTMKDRGLYKLNEGKLIEISPTKVPRIIGKKGTMIQMLKDKTGCRIVVGQNGRIWISGVRSDLAIEAIRLIEKNAHKQGLTDEIQTFLNSKVNGGAPAPAAAPATPAPVAPAKPVAPKAPAAPVAPTPATKPVPKVKKLGEAALPKLKGAEKPEKDNVDDMEVF